MAPVLFLFLMQAMAETLDEEWNKAGIEVPNMSYHKTTKANHGVVRGQNWRTKGTEFSIFKILYVDDGSFVFTSKEDMIKGA